MAGENERTTAKSRTHAGREEAASYSTELT